MPTIEELKGLRILKTNKLNGEQQKLMITSTIVGLNFSTQQKFYKKLNTLVKNKKCGALHETPTYTWELVRE